MRRDGAAADREWLRHVRPPSWRRPEPASRYDLVVIGGGTAGLVCAMGAAGLGARVALVERGRLGGDCLNTGCVPSKALIRSSRVIGELRRAAELGIEAGDVRVDFPAIVDRMREARATLAPHDSAARLQQAGVHVFFGEGAFSTPSSVTVEGCTLAFRRAVIATGTRPAVPPIAGLSTVRRFTNEDIFDIPALPRHLLVIGAGPIGCEIGQAFARFGARVTLIDHAPQVLPREGPEAAALVARALARDGVGLELGVAITRVADAAGVVEVHGVRQSESGATGTAVRCEGDALLVAAGRAPNVERLNLDAAGIRTDATGVAVDDRLRTSNRRVFASGDVCSGARFTHAADAMSRIVLQNALLFGRKRASALVIPRVTFTDPEVAHVGVAGHERGAGRRLAAVTVPLARVDRSVIDGETDGFVTVYHERGALRGVTIVGPHAGEMIGQATYALTHGGSLGGLSATVHAYPTGAEALRKAGDEYRRAALTAGVRRWLGRYFEWTRG